MDPTPNHRRGNAALIFGLLLVLVLGIAALVIDIGNARMVGDQLLAAVDASALGGVARLDFTTAGLSAARETALEVAAQNAAGGAPVQLVPDDVELGIWDFDASTFALSEDPARVNALRVTHHRDDIPAWYASIAFNDRRLSLTRSAIAARAVRAAGAVDCYVPLAIPDCVLGYSDQGLMDRTFVFSPSGVDNVGWGRAGGSPNASFLSDQIEDCNSGGVAEAGDTVGVQNGVVASVIRDMADRIEGSNTVWDSQIWGTQPAQSADSIVKANRYGHTYEGPILVFDGADSYCQTGGSFNGEFALVGFLWGAVYDVTSGGKGGATQKNVMMRINVADLYDVGSSGGGVGRGVVYMEPLLVK